MRDLYAWTQAAGENRWCERMTMQWTRREIMVGRCKGQSDERKKHGYWSGAMIIDVPGMKRGAVACHGERWCGYSRVREKRKA